MRQFGNFSITRQLKTIFGIQLALMAAIAAMTFQLREEAQTYSARVQHETALVLDIRRFGEERYQLQREAFRFLLQQDRDQLRSFRSRERELVSKFNNVLADYNENRKLLSAEARRAVEALQELVPRIEEQSSQLAKALEQGRSRSEVQRLLLAQDLFSENSEFNRTASRLLELERADLQEAQAKLELAMRRSNGLLVAGAALLLLATLALGLLGHFHISEPLRNVARIADEIAMQGRLEGKSEEIAALMKTAADTAAASDNEVTLLIRSFRRLVETMTTLSRQARLISNDELDDPLLDERVPGALGRNVERMIAFVRSLMGAMKLVARGDFSQPLAGEGVLSDAFNKMVHRLSVASEEEQRLKSLVESTADFIAVTTLDGRLQYMNRPGRKLIGATDKDVRVMRLSECMSEDAKAIQQQALVSVLQWGRWEGELLMRHLTGGHKVPVNATGFLMKSGTDQWPIGVAWIAQDISDRKRIEEIAERQKTLFHTARMSSLGEMAAGIAHEINSPLTVITARAGQLREMAAKQALDPQGVAKAADYIETTAFRIAKIAKGLRSFARDADCDPFKRAPLKEIIEETLDLCRSKFLAQGVEVIVDEFPSNAECECRQIQIAQVLLNLLNNAYDAVSELPEKWIRISPYVKGGTVELCVTDSGGGIPKEMREKIMQPFFTTKGADRGTGLGLSISKSIIEAHHGSLFVDATSRNTRFVIRLPRWQQGNMAA